jgi:hypothetical protein
MRDVGLDLKGVLEAALRPWRNLGRLSSFAGRRIESMFSSPSVPVASPELEPEAARISRLVAMLGSNVERLLRTHQEAVVDRQYELGRIADASTEIYVSSCVLRRLESLYADHVLAANERRKLISTGRYYLQAAERRIRRALDDLWSNDDEATTQLADLVLGRQIDGQAVTEQSH